MPLAPIAAIIGAVAAAAGAGLSIDEAVNAPGKPKTPAVTPLNPEQQNNIKTAIGQAAPDIVSATGGSVSPAYTLALSQLLSGTGNIPGASGTAQGVINQLFGQGATGGPTTAGVGTVPQTGSNTASNFQPAGISGSGSGSFIEEGLSNLFSSAVG